MNNDLISRDDLLKRIDEEREYLKARGQLGAEHVLVHNLRDLVEDAPTVTPNIQEELDEDICKEFLNKRCLEVIPIETLIALQLHCGKAESQGVWVKKQDNLSLWYECSRCGSRPSRNCTGDDFLSNYCPNCGACMQR